MRYYCDEHDSYRCKDVKREKEFDSYIQALAEQGIILKLEPEAIAPPDFELLAEQY